MSLRIQVFTTAQYYSSLLTMPRFDNSLAHDYYIDGMRGNKKCIKLPRKLVTWE